jgi:hypothetical protein
MLPARNFKFFNEGSFRRTRNYRFCEKELAACRNVLPQCAWSMGARVDWCCSIVLVLEIWLVRHRFGPLGPRFPAKDSRTRTTTRTIKAPKESCSDGRPRIPHRRPGIRSAEQRSEAQTRIPPDPALIILASQGGSRLPSIPLKPTELCAV